MPPLPADEPSALLANVAWVRALARRLARDPVVGDDVSQQALVAALERPGETPTRPWLATVALNFLRQRARADSRRARHEERAAQRDERPSALEVIARAEAQQAVVAAVLRLEEPYRATVLLRFFEGLPPRAIARRDGVPVATVRTRVARALDRLRADLRRRHGGDRASLLHALAPLLAPPPGPAVLLGALAMNAKIAAAAVVVVAACAVLWTFRAGAIADGAAPAADRDAKLARAEAPVPSIATAAAERREPIASPSSPPPVLAATSRPGEADSELRRVRGRVLDVDSKPVGGVDVRFREGDEASRVGATTDGEGRFVLSAPWREGEIEVASPTWLTVLAGSPPIQRTSAEPIVVVAPRIALAGFVSDERGLPVEGAAVAIAAPDDLRASFREILDYSVGRGWTATSDARGRFELAEAPALPGARLVVDRAGFARHSEPTPQASALHLSVVLRREESLAGAIAGRVVDSSDRAVPGAVVSSGETIVATGDDGRFQLPAKAGRPSTVRAAKAGLLPAIAVVAAGGSGPIEMRLGDAPLSIRGEVVDADGRAVPGAIVALASATWFGMSGGRPDVLECVAAGSGPSPRVDADGEGRFRIDGLLAQDYALRAIDPRTLRAVEVDGVRAGRDDVHVELPAGGLAERVAGRVVDRRGAPIAGVGIRAVRNAFRIRMPGGGRFVTNASLPPVKTDADGRFELRRVASDDEVFLTANSPSIVTACAFRPYADGDEDVRLVASRRCHLKVELADAADRADRFSVLDEKGEPLEIGVVEGDSEWGSTTAKLARGRSEAVVVEETACTLVLFAGKEEIRRRSIDLAAGAVTVVRP